MRPNGLAIRSIREARNLSVRQLADTADLSTGYLSRLEREQVGATDETLHAIADALDVPVHAITTTGEVMTASTVDAEDTVLYRPEEAARRLEITTDWLVKRARRGEVPFTRVGRQMRFSAENLRDFIAMHQVMPKPRRRTRTRRTESA